MQSNLLLKILSQKRCISFSHIPHFCPATTLAQLLQYIWCNSSPTTIMFPCSRSKQILEIKSVNNFYLKHLMLIFMWYLQYFSLYHFFFQPLKENELILFFYCYYECLISPYQFYIIEKDLVLTYSYHSYSFLHSIVQCLLQFLLIKLQY